jgi:phosphatidylserine/phosphatidylglycerophosphate/cardiolipin synthase-like enzyme
MFRHMGRKLQEKFKVFSDTLFKREENASPKQSLSTHPEELKMQEDVAALALWSALQIPAFIMGRDDEGRRGLPIILAFLDVSLSEPPTGGTPRRQALNVTYEISLSYGPMKWSVHRRVYDFFRLHSILMFRHLQGGISVDLPHFPSQLSYLLGRSRDKSDAALNHSTSTINTNEGAPEDRRAARRRTGNERREALEIYLKELLRTMNMQVPATELLEFLECSMLSLAKLLRYGSNDRLKEGYLKNRIFGTQRVPRWYSCLLCKIPDRKKYRTKWFIVRGSYLAFVDRIDQLVPSDVLLCDTMFHVIVENEHAHQFLKPLTITIVNGCKKLEVRPESNSQMDYWLTSFRKLALECVWCHPHRFKSYAPVRTGCRMDWLIDAEQYYTALVRAIQGAKEDIYLHGWWISPELHLVRPAAAHPHMRLDRLLQRKAREGVKIYVIVFKEFSMALALNSYHTKASLERLHPNIRVQRHPDHLGGVLYWAHHEKLAIIDQRIAFTGGLDLCFGRYDASNHALADHFPGETARQIWGGLDYANPRIRDFRNVVQHTSTLVDRTVVPRMPWHDVHCVVYGSPARDLARHFIERWNFVKQQKAMHKTEHIPFLLPNPEYTLEQLETEGFTGTVRVQAVRSVAEWSIGRTPETSIYEAYLHYIENARHFIYIENQFFISRSSEQQSSPIRNRIAQAIVERILRAVEEKKQFRVFFFMPLLPAFEAAVNRSEASSLRMIMQGQYSGISRGPNSILGQLQGRGIRAEDYISFFSLRKHASLDGRAVTEQLYIHSKLLIVDDQVAIMGSANINDRSMLGARDSEIDVIVEDEEQLHATLNGQATTVARKVRELRVQLMQEHLGLLHLPASDPAVKMLLDPTPDAFYHDVLRQQAARNTQIYRELFHCVPDDCVDTWEEYRRFTEIPRAHVLDEKLGINSLEMLDAIKGSVVLYPTHFLRKEDLAASLLTPEFLLPIEVYL